ncbi:MAG: hypothetical protein AABZ33_07005 [Chloroflexota bacterium]
MSRSRTRAGARRGPDRGVGSSRRRGFRGTGIVVAGALGLVAVLAALAWTGAAAAQRGWSPPDVAGDEIVARVHGEPVPWAQVAERMKAATVMGRPAPGDLRAWREEARQTIESIIGDVLTRHAVEAEGLSVTDAMIDAEVRRLEERYGGDAGLARAMGEMQVTMAELRETQRRGLYLQALIEGIVPASDADVDAYLAQAGAAGLSRSDAAARVRADRAAEVIPTFLAELRRDPGIWVIDIEELK